MKKYRVILNITICLMLIFFFSSCGGDGSMDKRGDAQSSNYGSIAAKINWYNSYPSDDKNTDYDITQDQSNTLTFKAITSKAVIPTGVVTVKISVSASDMATITRSFSYEAHHGIIGGIPVGSDRTFTCVGLDSFGAMTYQGVRTGISIEQDITTTVAVNTYWAEELPVAPSGLITTIVSSSQIDLRWTDNSTNEDGFKIERKTEYDVNYGQIATVGVNSTTYQDVGLSADITYSYRIKAFNAHGDSSYSNEKSAATYRPPITITVCGSSCNYSSIQEAIDDAVDGDIILVGNGTYYEAIDFKGKVITVKSVNGAGSTIIDASSNGKVITFGSGESSNSILEGFTITGGLASGSYRYSKMGGGIYCKSFTSPSINNCTISSNFADYYGGGIYCSESSFPTITNCSINGNTSEGIYCASSSSPTITNCSINENLGHGIYCDGDSSPSISNCTIKGNDSGSGIYFYYSSPTISNVIICGNSTNRGGGIYSVGNGSSPTIINCTISGNLATNIGGGIYCLSSSPTVINSIFWGNSAGSNGDEVYLSTISGSYNPTSINISYSVIDSSLIELEEGGTTTLSNNINSDPLFVDPRDTSNAPTSEGDYHLQSASPCIDNGTSSGAPSDDIDGDNRLQGAGCDMGADEYVHPGPPTPTNVIARSGIFPTANSSISCPGIEIKWDGKWDGVGGVTYNIYWNNSSGVSKTNYIMFSTVELGRFMLCSATVSSSESTYYFVVTAVDYTGESKESLEVNASMP